MRSVKIRGNNIWRIEDVENYSVYPVINCSVKLALIERDSVNRNSFLGLSRF